MIKSINNFNKTNKKQKIKVNFVKLKNNTIYNYVNEHNLQYDILAGSFAPIKNEYSLINAKNNFDVEKKDFIKPFYDFYELNNINAVIYSVNFPVISSSKALETPEVTIENFTNLIKERNEIKFYPDLSELSLLDFLLGFHTNSKQSNKIDFDALETSYKLYKLAGDIFKSNNYSEDFINKISKCNPDYLTRKNIINTNFIEIDNLFEKLNDKTYAFVEKQSFVSLKQNAITINKALRSKTSRAFVNYVLSYQNQKDIFDNSYKHKNTYKNVHLPVLISLYKKVPILKEQKELLKHINTLSYPDLPDNFIKSFNNALNSVKKENLNKDDLIKYLSGQTQ